MKKIAKLSLVAAVAVAGLTNVNAASLEEAIKGVDVSGQFRYRFQEKKIDQSTTGNETNSDVEIEVGVKVPVTDNVTAVFKIDNANNDTDNAKPTSGSVDIEDYYFSYSQDALTINAGQQNIPGRMTDGAQGDGAVALYNLGNFTVGAAAFANHNVQVGSGIEADIAQAIAGSGVTPTTANKTAAATAVAGVNGELAGTQLLSVIAMGNIGPVSLLAQYADVEDTVKSYNLKADVALSMVKAGVEYTASELDSAVVNTVNSVVLASDAIGDDDRSTLKAYVAGNVSIVSAKLTYAKTGDNGSGSIDSQVSRDGLETPSEFLLWNLGTSNNADMDVYAIDASVKVTPKISLRAAYAAGEIGTGTGKDVEETLGQISYKASKNLNAYIRYAQFDASASNDNDGQRGRVEVKYSF